MPTLIQSPFIDAFEEFVGGVQTRLLICSPYITSTPVRRLLKVRRKKPETPLRMDVLTDISLANLVNHATEISALLDLYNSGHDVSITYLPRLHAKVYIADRSRAIVASANFTEGGMRRNFEYGVRIDHSPTVVKIERDMNAYKTLGANPTKHELENLKEQVDAVKRTIEKEQRTIRQTVRQKQQIEDTLLKARVRQSNIQSIFASTILYLLSSGPETTVRLNQKIQNIHPDLCDDTIDRVINGEHFGKRWKHTVRNAQQSLKKSGRVGRDKRTRKWHKIKK